jgi:F0F1-type ATP synthase membrane subunit b/b'
MQKLLGERWSLIDGRLEEAKALQEEAYMLSQELQKELEFSKDRAHDQILATSRQLSIDLNKKRLELSKVSKEKFRAAELRTFEKKSSAMGHVQEIALDLTDYIGSLLLSEPISSSTVQKTVSSYLSHGSDHEL